MTTATANAFNDFFNFLDEHAELIQFRRWGYLEEIQKKFNESSNIQRGKDWIKKHLHIYRIMKNKPIEYVPNPYYHSQKKGNLQEK